jgi:hypothetical protein
MSISKEITTIFLKALKLKNYKIKQEKNKLIISSLEIKDEKK